MTLVEKHQDVTTLPIRYVIAHCISVDCAMGAGVVVPIKNKFKNVKSACIKYTQTKDNALGTAFRYELSNVGVVYNMFSKDKVYQKAGVGISYSQYMKQLKECLYDMKKQMLENNETILGIPKIGCGLDRGKWSDVKAIIQEVFEDTDINILVCLWN